MKYTDSPLLSPQIEDTLSEDEEDRVNIIRKDQDLTFKKVT